MRRKYTKREVNKIIRLTKKGVSDRDIIVQTEIPKHKVTAVTTEYWNSKKPRQWITE